MPIKFEENFSQASLDFIQPNGIAAGTFDVSNVDFCKQIKSKNKLVNFKKYSLIINTDYSNSFTKTFSRLN